MRITIATMGNYPRLYGNLSPPQSKKVLKTALPEFNPERVHFLRGILSLRVYGKSNHFF